MTESTSPRFILIKDSRIRLASIKHYGISCETLEAYVEQKTNVVNWLFDSGNDIMYVSAKRGKQVSGTKTPEMRRDPGFDKKGRYLYVTMEEGDNHLFFEDEVEIDKYLAQLDAALT